mmetsp:Transcript_14525/g.18353  ORF Transcript_14525/g.18353 Transcript_14525/m.18353 type:complete len:215 (+) Transcript_14525:128-772(+)
MQRLSRDLRDCDEPVRRSVRCSSTEKVLDDLDGEGEKIRSRIQQLRTVEISTVQGFSTTARLDESGEFDSAMKEWTVYFLEKDHSSLCPLESLNAVKIKVGNKYSLDFQRLGKKIHVRLHNVESQGEKSLVFSFGNELMLLARVTGCPEERSPNADDDIIYEGDLPSLINMLKSEEMLGAEISFGCIIFKDFLLKNQKKTGEEGKRESNWETFV